MLSGSRLNSRPANWSAADEFDDGSSLAVGEGADGLALGDGDECKKALDLGGAPSLLCLQQVENSHVLDTFRFIADDLGNRHDSGAHIAFDLVSGKSYRLGALKRHKVLRLFCCLRGQLLPPNSRNAPLAIICIVLRVFKHNN